MSATAVSGVVVDSWAAKSRVRNAALVIGLTVFTALSAQIAIPLPFTPVPLTLQTFAVLAGAAGCYALKYVGSVIPAHVLEQPTVKKIVLLLPISLLSALVAVQTFATSQTLVFDARVPALAAATVALKFKAPFIFVVLIAAATAAALRYFGLAV